MITSIPCLLCGAISEEVLRVVPVEPDLMVAARKEGVEAERQRIMEIIQSEVDAERRRSKTIPEDGEGQEFVRECITLLCRLGLRIQAEE